MPSIPFYSYLKESTGFNLDARYAGATPDKQPTINENNNAPSTNNQSISINKKAGPIN